MLEEVVRFDMNKIRGKVPNIFTIINNANLREERDDKVRKVRATPFNAYHGVPTGEQGGHVGSFRSGVETLVSRQDSVAEILLVWVQEGRDGVSVQAGTESANVELVEF